ncbi:MAG TPA: hypothetical protein VGU20_30090 [Stellaceae bacterium]|nr:hypothetical protein [Stellaceae bacterium]
MLGHDRKDRPTQHAHNNIYIDCYHDYKSAKGYSRTEITRKRDALENRLIPFRPEENLAMLREAGFEEAEIFFTWLNFQGYLAVKAAPLIVQAEQAR